MENNDKPFLFQVDLLLSNTRPHYVKKISQEDYDLILALQKRIPTEVLVETIASQNLGLTELFDETVKMLEAQGLDPKKEIEEEFWKSNEVTRQIGLVVYAAAAIVGSLVDKEKRLQFKEKDTKEFTDSDKDFLNKFKIKLDGE